jgi:choline kinase
LDIDGVSLLHRQARLLRSFGITDLVVVRGFNAQAIEVPGARYYLNPDFERTNMVHSLFCAERELSDDVLIAYADILYDKESLSRILAPTQDHILVAVDMNWETYYRSRYGDPFSEAESLVLEPDNRITEIGDGAPPRAKIQAQYIGLIRLRDQGTTLFGSYYRRFADQFQNSEWLRGRPFNKAHMTDFLQGLINEGVRVQGIPIQGGWLEFDTPTDYEKVKAWQAAGTLDQFCRLQSIAPP